MIGRGGMGSILVSLCAIVGVGLMGCNRLADISNCSSVAEVLSDDYELTTDLLVYEAACRPVRHVIAYPGCSAKLPVSVEDYLASPEGWMHSKEYIERWGQPRVYYRDIQGVLFAGTVVRVEKVVEVPNREVGPILVPLVSVEDERFSGLLLDGGTLFIDRSQKIPRLQPSPRLMREIPLGGVGRD